MKHVRSHRHLRPRLNRRQIHRETMRVRSAVQLFQVEWLAEAAKAEPSLTHLHLLNDSIQTMNDELDSLARC